MDWLVKVLFFALLAPFFVCLAVQLLTGLLAAILPWLILGWIVGGIVTGLTAAIVLARRLPPRNGGALPPRGPALGPYRVRRSRGGSEWRTRR